MFVAAASARGDRFQLIAAHFAFFLLNMATMPFWQVEGLALYGLLCGYTIHAARAAARRVRLLRARSEEHTSELQSLMRISYAVFCLKKNKRIIRSNIFATIIYT